MRNVVLTGLILAFLATEAAASTGGGSLPWETPLQTIATSITGPVAYAISLIDIVVAGAMLVWGGEVNELWLIFLRLFTFIY
jgi:type IV secretion system protein VirB2